MYSLIGDDVWLVNIFSASKVAILCSVDLSNRQIVLLTIFRWHGAANIFLEGRTLASPELQLRHVIINCRKLKRDGAEVDTDATNFIPNLLDRSSGSKFEMGETQTISYSNIPSS